MVGGLLALVVVLLALILVSLWVVLYQPVKQQGRLLLRLEDVERRLAHGGTPMRGLGADGAQAQPRGVAAGAPIAPFRLPDLAGREISLEEFQGKRVLLTHWNPRCGFCDLIAPDLDGLQADLKRHNVQLLLVSHADAEANRELAEEHSLECPILLLGDAPMLDAFQHLGTPVAYLLDEQGRVAGRLAVGADQVLALAREAATGRPGRKRLGGERPLSESRIERDGLKAGTPAPLFQLPDLSVRTVALEEYRGRRVLLVFSDPHCVPCDELAPHLVRLHREYPLAVVMVARGDLEENRRKAEEHRFEFPVLLQRKWELSKTYGIFATPVAFLIGEDGAIARNVARGPEEILALAREALAAGKERSDERKRRAVRSDRTGRGEPTAAAAGTAGDHRPPGRSGAG